MANSNVKLHEQKACQEENQHSDDFLVYVVYDKCSSEPSAVVLI